MDVAAQLVFPACAGMFLPVIVDTIRILGFPRVRGDVPETIMNLEQFKTFSPRARGCSHRP